jgi:hypothetical protein
MLLVFFGPSCSGKSTVAQIIAERTGATVWAGGDYLRLAKTEPEARKIFLDLLRSAAGKPDLAAGSIIFIVTDPGRIDPGIDRNQALTVKFTAHTDALQSRFRKRNGGQLPDGVTDMLDRQLQQARAATADLKFDTSQMHPEIIADAILVYAQSRAALPDRSRKQQ